MSKYLRLTTINNLGKVETNFNQDINIDKDSKIALLNASFSVDSGNFTVEPENNTISYNSIVGGNTSTVNLTNRTYNRTTALDFLDDIQLQCNNQQLENQQNIGNQFQVQPSKTGKVEIQSKISPNNSQLFSTFTEGNKGIRAGTSSLTLTGNNTRVRNTGASVGTHQNYIATFSEIGRGISQVKAKINRLDTNGANTAQNGFIIGLSTKNPSQWVLTANLLPVADMGYCVEVNDPNVANNNQQLRFRDGSQTANSFQDATGIALQKTGNNATLDANQIEVIFVGGKIQFRLYRTGDGGDHTNFVNIGGGSFDVDEDTELYPYIILKGEQGLMNLTDYRFYLDPYKSDLSNFLNPNNDEEAVVGASPLIVRNKSGRRLLTFDSIDLANILGFNSNVILNIAQTRGEYRAEAQNLFDALIRNPYFCIRMLNMELESYDGTNGGRFNIISSFGDNSQNTNDSVFYEASNPIFLKISNSSPRSIRNMKCEILKADLSPVSTDGFISLVFLIQ